MVVVFQHVPFEGPAAIADWAQARGEAVKIVHAYQGEDVAVGAEASLLVVMGGPMSVNDTHIHPWIEPELAVLHERIAADRSTLGVCLGAQLIAKAAGSMIYQAAETEIGWYPVQRTTEAGLGRLLPDKFTPLHWHGETFDLPENALHLAKTEACLHQAFQLGQCVLGFQYHIEATRESLAALIENCGHEIGEGRFQMPAEQMLAQASAMTPSLHPMLFDLLDALVDRA